MSQQSKPLDPHIVRRVRNFYMGYRGKVVQEVDCPSCGQTDNSVCEDDRVTGTTYMIVCPNITCGETIHWTDEGDG